MASAFLSKNKFPSARVKSVGITAHPRGTKSLTRRFSYPARLLACLFLPSLAGCGATNTASADAIATFSLTTRAGITDYAVDPSPLKRASAEIFRVLATSSPIVRQDVLDQQIYEAAYAEKGVHQSLGPAVKAQMETALAALHSAQRQNDRKAVAMAALSAFRLLTEDQADSGKIPSALSLIDYVRLLCATQLKSEQPDWQMMDDALAFGDKQLRIVSNDIDKPELVKGFSASLACLQVATKEKNIVSARYALARTQAQFTQLKQHFEQA